MSKFFKYILISLFILSIIFFASIDSKRFINLKKTELSMVNSGHVFGPFKFSDKVKKISFYINYQRIDIKNLLKINIFLIIRFFAILFLLFFSIDKLIGIFKVFFKKKKHFIAKYVNKIYTILVRMVRMFGLNLFINSFIESSSVFSKV